VAARERNARSRARAAYSVGGALATFVVSAALLPGTASSGAERRSADPTTVKVTLGKPFLVTPKAAPAGSVVFQVQNGAKTSYRFAVCIKPTAATAANVTTCISKTTPLLKPGQAGSLTLALPTKGAYRYYEYTTPATSEFPKPPKSAGAGMNGVLTVSGKSAPGAAPAPASGSSTAALAEGKSLFKSKCGSCHALADAKTRGGIGPDLDQLAPAKATVARQVRSGGGQMPSFAAVLTPAQINAVAAYVYSATHK
jgi:mono/diheme cytochrome c family protein